MTIETDMRAEDGSALTRAATAKGGHTCEVCQAPLGAEQWWVTHYPSGVHTLCRDWRAVAFPFERHLTLLRRMRFSTDGEATALVVAADDWLVRLAHRWPEPAAKGVLDASRLLRRLRTRLMAAGVDTKLVNQL